MRIVTDTQIELNKCFKAAAIFMDLTSALDTVCHNGFIYELYSMNLPIILIRWIINFLTNRSTKIKFGSEFSEGIIIKRGVPQSAALSPILHSVYVNDTPASENNLTQLVFC